MSQFGLYLLENNKIDKETFLSLLSQQIKSQESLIGILPRLFPKTSELIVKLIADQSSEPLLVKLKSTSITDEEIQKALEEQKRTQVSFSELLIKNDILALEDINSSMASFLEGVSSNQQVTNAESNPKNEEVAVQEKQESTDSLVSNAAVESLREQVEAGLIEQSVLDDFLASEGLLEESPSSHNKENDKEVDNQDISKKFDNEEIAISKDFLNSLENEVLDQDSLEFLDQILIGDDVSELKSDIYKLKDFQEEPDKFKELCRNLAEGFHLQRGMAKIMNALFLEKSLAFLENSFAKLSEQESMEDIDSTCFEDLLKFLEKTIELKNSLEKTANENSYLREGDNLPQLMKNYKHILEKVY